MRALTKKKKNIQIEGGKCKTGLTCSIKSEKACCFFYQYAVDGLEEDVVDYGTVGTGENRTKLLKIFNNNPIEVGCNSISITLHLCLFTMYVTSSFVFFVIKIVHVH